MTGYLNVRQAAEFLGGRSLSWMRLHSSSIPHYRLHDRLLFSPAELKTYVERTATRHDPIDIDRIVAEAMMPGRKRRAAR